MNMVSLSLRGGRVVRADGLHKEGVWVRDGRIAARSPGACTQEIDTRGCVILPGFIDPHVHFNEPGRTAWEGFATGSRALAAGGVTTFIDMPLNSSPPVVSVAALEAKRKRAARKAVVDFGFWGGLIPGNAASIPTLAAAGVVAMKAFFCESGLEEFPACSERDLREGARACAECGLVLAVHAEDPRVLARATPRLGGGWSEFVRSRPEEAEVAAVRRILKIATETGCAVHIVHVSAPGALDLLAEARRAGVDATCEVCTHHLVLEQSTMQEWGTIAKCAPPLRPQETIEALWQRVLDGTVDMIGSDHSPCPPSLKRGGDFFSAWGGISGCQHAMLVFVQEANRRGVSWSRIAALTSANAARRFHLLGKGSLASGDLADLAVLEPCTPTSPRRQELLYRHKVSPYLSSTLAWKVRVTVRGGVVVHDDGKTVDGGLGQEVATW